MEYAEEPQEKQQSSDREEASAEPQLLGMGQKGYNPYLPTPVRQKMEAHLGHDFSRVNIYQDSQVAASLAVKSFAYGNSIHFAPGAYEPETADGQKIIIHELMHVVQQRQGSSGTDVQKEEKEAKSAEEELTDKTRPETSLAPHKEVTNPFPQFFEAPKHESVEYYALRKNYSNFEIQSIYYGNWMRDMNQAFAPILIDLFGYDKLYTLLSVLSYRKFGKIPTQEQLGYYIPSEHLDNPAGAIPGSEYPQTKPYEGDGNNGDSAPEINPEGASPISPELKTTQESTLPNRKIASGMELFDYDNQGVLGFVRRSNNHLEKRLIAAAKAGRNEEGFLHLGAGLHVVEDLFAHSNFVEIAVEKTIKAPKNRSFYNTLPKEHKRVQTFSPRRRVGDETIPLLTTG
ncbi:MAG: DUF4157 domain-containing protein, partial [Bacteroidota bacterium]